MDDSSESRQTSAHQRQSKNGAKWRPHAERRQTEWEGDQERAGSLETEKEVRTITTFAPKRRMRYICPPLMGDADIRTLTCVLMSAFTNSYSSREPIPLFMRCGPVRTFV